MTCKYCVHYVVCERLDAIFNFRNMPSPIHFPTICSDFFKNKANVLEIPDIDIIYTKDKWLVLNMESEHLGKAIKSIIDYCTKNARKD